MTATVVDHPDKQHQQQDQEHTSKQHLSQQLQREHDIVVTSMGGTDDEVAVAVSRDISVDESHQAIAEQDSTKKQYHSGRIPDIRILSANASNTKTKKSRRRRGGKGRWKPYHTLSLKEKIAQEEKEVRNAVEKRERLFSRGKPMAPYNTTQFLLEDHEKRTMPPDVGDSSGMAAHQRQSTGGFSPTRESYAFTYHLPKESEDSVRFWYHVVCNYAKKKCDERIATTTYIHIHTRMCYAPFSVDSENLQRRADFHTVDLASHSVPEHRMLVFKSCRNIIAAGNYSAGNEASRIFGTIGQSGSEMGGNTTDSASYSGAEDDEMERQFDADYDYVNMERISNMTKDEVVREYMHLEKINGKLADRMSLLQLENDKLKQLLKDHNISYENVLPKIRRHSGASVSEASDVVRKSLDEVMVESGQ
ncbi:unnamed protein product [Cercopithifilaria johnstoni]|uniref:Uncharacterized protein n=1 Tax=Cercopithifilaria johnstoni TaxID=2874296 RepID=A0A8J2PQW1_9BILA|nr:unnamed protein product [Cercopithifilaria johnstoni]